MSLCFSSFFEFDSFSTGLAAIFFSRLNFKAEEMSQCLSLLLTSLSAFLAWRGLKLLKLAVERKSNFRFSRLSSAGGWLWLRFLLSWTSRRYIKERVKQTMTEPNCNLLEIWEHSPFSWWSCSCLHPMRWQISYLDQSKDRGCSVALHNSWLIYFALSFIYLHGVAAPVSRVGPGSGLTL